MDLRLRLLRFAGASGVGLGLDVVLYSALNLAGVPAGWANVVSAGCAVTFVYFASLRHVFDARERTREHGLLVNYLGYQAVAIPAASALVGLASHLLDDRWLLAKGVTLPLTFAVNYLFMTWLLRPTGDAVARG